MTEVDKIQASAPVAAERAKFSRCVVREGVPAAESKDFHGFITFLDGLEMNTITDQQRTAIDTHWTKIFVRCASSTVTLQERLQQARKKAFVQERYPQIRELQSRTDSVLARLDSRFGLSASQFGASAA